MVSDMKRRSITAAILLASSAAWAGDIPFSPAADVPDYVATTTTEKAWGRPAGPQTRIVMHHDGWVRVDEPQSTTYGNSDKQISIVVRRHPQASYASVLISRATPVSRVRIRGASRSGKIETHAGEQCDVWQVQRLDPDRADDRPTWLSCLTSDGIEIGSNVMSSSNSVLSQSTAVGLDRRPVSVADVTLPADLFDVARWLNFDDEAVQGGTAAKQPSDYVLHMHSEDAAKVLRRHGAWTYDETTFPDGRRKIEIWNAKTGQRLSFHTEEGGAFAYLFMLQKYLPGETMIPPFGPSGTPRKTGRQSSVLGEPCEWFNVAPNMMDAGLHYCLTRDGVPLKIRIGGQFSSAEFVADEVQRRNLKSEEILPPADVLMRSNWDIPG